MTSWQFNYPLGKVDVVELDLEMLMHAALQSTPVAPQSGYLVHAAGLIANNHLVRGANREYSIGRGIHSEEALVSAAVEMGGQDAKLRIIAIAAGEPGKIGTPCGNCRDILREYTTDDAILICGSQKGGCATVMPLKAYFKNTFAKLSFPELTETTTTTQKAIYEARDAKTRAYHPVVPKERVYGAAFSCSGKFFSGHFHGDSAFHPSYPIMNAISVMINSPQEERWNVEQLVIVRTGAQDIPYLDRQHLLEFEDELRKKHGRQVPIEVKLVDVDDKEKIVSAWKTDSTDWLPYPFRL